MAEITMQRKGELLRKVFELLQENPDGLRARTVPYHLPFQFLRTLLQSALPPSRPLSSRRRRKSCCC